MKRNLCTILAVLTAVPGYAASLNPADWEVIENAAPPSSCFTFGDGNLYATGNSNGKELFYKVKEGTNLMVNGSGLTITLQFNNAAFLADESTRTVIEVNEDGVEEELEERRATEFHINFHNDNSDADGGGDNYFHSVRVYNSGDEQLNIYDSGSQDDYFTLDSSADSITTIKVNYTIKNNYLHYSYELNGAASEEYVFTKNGEVNPEIEWRPSFDLSNTASTIYTVTDVTFISAPVPEPATATLSLLALAGLATRRLRK